MQCVLVRYAELGIKSDQTRKMWLRQLRDNVVRCLAWDDIPYSRVKIVQGRLIVYTRDGSAPACLRRVFGVASVSPAVELPSDMERIKKEALSLFHAHAPKSFRVTSQRVTKDFPLTSQQINEQVGEAVYEAGGTVRLTAYELNIRIEIIHGRAYVFSSALQGVGGLPLGTQQRGCAVVETERDVLAALLFMRRGCPVELVVLDTNQAGQYLSILQDAACCGLPAILAKDADDVAHALCTYRDAGTKVVVSGAPLVSAEGMLNLCPCELYDAALAQEALSLFGVAMKRNRTAHLFSAGGVVFSGDEVLVIRRSDDGTWVLPKGKVQPRERFREAAAREICEETGLCGVSVGDYVGMSRYTFRTRGATYAKDVCYYLCETPTREVRLERLFDKHLFVSPEVALGLVSFENDVYLLARAMRLRARHATCAAPGHT